MSIARRIAGLSAEIRNYPTPLATWTNDGGFDAA